MNISSKHVSDDHLYQNIK